MEIPEIPKNKDMTYLGLTTFRDKGTLFGIRRKDRRQHVYVLGKSGTGKSVLLSNMIIQNIQNGDGVCVVDPHGELVEGILQAIPPHRMRDVIYFNPADTDYHIGFNVLELKDPKYKHLVASGLMGIFTKIWANAWSARMEYILNNAILALLDTPGTTLLGIPRMLVDKDYRQKIIGNLKDPVIKAFWIHEYEQWQDKFRNEAIAPIQNKVGQFLSTSIIRNVVGQSKSTIDVFDIMNQGKIFLVNVSKGRIGEDNSALLGGMIITKIQLAAMERVRIPEENRKDFYLYVDEFQNFVTDSFASILSEARKYRLNLTVAHQYTAQLVTENGSAVRDAVFGNVGTMIVFRVGADDADFLEKEFEPEFTPQDIVNLPNYRAYLRLMIDGVTSRPFSAKTLPPMITNPDPKVEEEVIRSSREYYCRPKEVIEREINEWSGMMVGGDEAYNPSAEKFSAVCSICGKETTVPFKPEPGRPVYCKECITKIKAGEIKPVKGSSMPQAPVKYDEDKFYQPLADLGIEFTSKKQTPSTPSPIVEQNKNKPGIFSAIKKVFIPKPSLPMGVKPIPKPLVSSLVPIREIPIPTKFVQPTRPVGGPVQSVSAPLNPVRPVDSSRPIDEVRAPSKWVNKPARPAGENLALREILNKTLSESKILEPKPSLSEIKIVKKPEPAPISLSELKPRVEPVLSSKDRSASSADMDKLKDLISGKVESALASIPKSEPKMEPAPIPEPKQEIKPEPILTPEISTPKSSEPEPISPQPAQSIQQPPVNNIREVPEDVLRKMLE